MLDENERESSRSDALRAYESLFGDTAAESAAATAGEQEIENKVEQEPKPSDDSKGEGREGNTILAEELKVVVSIKEGRATIGVQRPSSDPHIESFDDPDLSGLAQEVLPVVERARVRWEGAPKYPAHARPAAATRRRGRGEQGPVQASTAEGEEAQQEPETLRLF